MFKIRIIITAYSMLKKNHCIIYKENTQGEWKKIDISTFDITRIFCIPI